MRSHTQQTALASLASLLLLPSFTSAIGFDCENVRVDGIKFDLSPLNHVHEISHVQEFDNHIVNTSYVLNPCNTLSGAAKRGKLNCGASKNICGFQSDYNSDEDTEDLSWFTIAGLDSGGGGSKDPEVTRLKKEDPTTEGLRVKLSGGSVKDGAVRTQADSSKEKPAAAVIEFQCDPSRTGLEHLHNDDDLDKKTGKKMSRRDDEKGEDDEPSLKFKSFELIDDKSWILRLDWKTKYACENYERENPSEPNAGGHWGLFTWLIIIVFLSVAAYLIFGSWLNYNRYGARGWDLLPHADTIRDIPYIFQDWMRRVINSLQGPGARGGYAAV